VCVCSTCVAVFARCVELSRGCGMIRAKSSTTQVCFICGVAGCEIRGWRSRVRSLSLSLVSPDLPPSPTVHDDLSVVWPDVIENSAAIFRDTGSCGGYAIMQSPACYVMRIIYIMSGILHGRMSILIRHVWWNFNEFWISMFVIFCLPNM